MEGRAHCKCSVSLAPPSVSMQWVPVQLRGLVREIMKMYASVETFSTGPGDLYFHSSIFIYRAVLIGKPGRAWQHGGFPSVTKKCVCIKDQVFGLCSR